MKQYLLKALELAESRRGYCWPNPAVGAVVVKDEQIIATGTHWAAGHPHAEVEALRRAGEEAKGATLYVTLEPCCHHGKTPPCTEAIIASKVKRVVFGFRDPNAVASKGKEQLIAAGIDCEWVALPEIDRFYRSYAYWIEKKRPWVCDSRLNRNWLSKTKSGFATVLFGKRTFIFGSSLRMVCTVVRIASAR